MNYNYDKLNIFLNLYRSDNKTLKLRNHNIIIVFSNYISLEMFYHTLEIIVTKLNVIKLIMIDV